MPTKLRTQCSVEALLKAGVPMAPLGLTIEQLLGEARVRDAWVRTELERRKLPPAVDLGLNLSVPAGPLNLIPAKRRFYEPALLDVLDIPWTEKPDERLPPYKVFRRTMPLYRLGVEQGEDFVHRAHFDAVYEYFMAAGPAGIRCFVSEVDCTAEAGSPPLPEVPMGPLSSNAALGFLTKFPGAVARFRKEYLMPRWGVRLLEPMAANTFVSARLGIPVDMRSGRLLSASEEKAAVGFSYGCGAPPPTVEFFIKRKLPRVHAQVGSWAGAEIEGAVWSSALQVALWGPKYLQRWLGRHKPG